MSGRQMQKCGFCLYDIELQVTPNQSALQFNFLFFIMMLLFFPYIL